MGRANFEKNCYIPPKNNSRLMILSIRQGDYRKTINKPKNNATGYDNITSYCVKMITSLVIELLTILINNYYACIL